MQVAVLGLFSCILTLYLFIFVLNSVSFGCFMALCDDSTHQTLCSSLRLTDYRPSRQFYPGPQAMSCWFRGEGACAPPRDHDPSKGLARLCLSALSPHIYLETPSVCLPVQPVNRLLALWPPPSQVPRQAGNGILQVVKHASEWPD